MLFDSPLISRASGSLAGITASRNRSGNYFRARVTPVNPNTAPQQAVRSRVSELSNLWVNVLTAADRGKWNDYAANVSLINKLGNAFFATGMNHYIRSNVPRLQAFMPRQDTAPSIFDLGQFTFPFMGASEATQLCSFAFTEADAWVNEDDSAMLIYVARPQNQTINYFKGPYQLAGTIAGSLATPLTTPQTVTSPFGFVEDQKIFARVTVTRADGRLSSEHRLFDIAAA